MSRIRIVGGKIIKNTAGEHSIFSKGNIILNAKGRIIQEGKENGVHFGEPKKYSSPINDEKNFLEPLIIYVSGYWNKDIPYAGEEWGIDYWGPNFKKEAHKYFGTTKEYFLNGAGEWYSSGWKRYKSGNKFAEERYNNSQSKFYKEVFKEE